MESRGTDVSDEGVPLEGGNMTSVVRVGGTVRRTPGPWSAAVLGLLEHVRTNGFMGAPPAYGFDERGREVLGFVPGEVGNYQLAPYMLSDAVLTEAARLLRGFHDAQLGYRAPEGTVWRLPHPDPGAHEVICHNDFAPYNLVFGGGVPQAVIDFDTAGPGPRIWDVAYAAYRFVPLSDDEHSRSLGWRPPYERGRRLRLFCDSYGLDRPEGLLPTVERRLNALIEVMMRGAEAGDPAFRRVVAEGHHEAYERDIRFVAESRAELERALLDARQAQPSTSPGVSGLRTAANRRGRISS